MTQSGPSVGLPRIVGVVTICHGGIRDDHHVVELRPNSARGSSVASRFSCESGGLSDLVGSHPKHETNHWTPLYSEALIGRRVSRPPGYTIRFG
jgi:hypothetical protein